MRPIGDDIILPKMALKMFGIYMDDKEVDLMVRVLQTLEQRKGLFNIKDAFKIEREHRKDWLEYEEIQKKALILNKDDKT